MSVNLSNDTILDKLRNGSAKFELVSSAVESISAPKPNSNSNRLLNNTNFSFFARLGPPLSGVSSSNIKVERYAIQKVTGDGRCMFRALVSGIEQLAQTAEYINKEEREIHEDLPPPSPRGEDSEIEMADTSLSNAVRKEMRDAMLKALIRAYSQLCGGDELRAAVKEVICENENERRQYQEAITAITVDEPLHRYCQRIGRYDFWGGESELLVLSKLCNQQIIVYIPENEHKSGKLGNGFIPIAEYGAVRKKQPRHIVRLLYSGRSHYDLLV